MVKIGPKIIYKCAYHLASVYKYDKGKGIDDIVNILKLPLLITPTILDTMDNVGRTAVFLACQEDGWYSALVMLLHGGASPSCFVRPKLVTPLHIASRRRDKRMVVSLIKAAVKKGKKIGRRQIINLKDKRGRTPLHIASSKGNVGIMEKLISYNANIFATTNEQRTPLFYASERGHVEAVKILIASMKNYFNNMKSQQMVATRNDKMDNSGRRSVDMPTNLSGLDQIKSSIYSIVQSSNLWYENEKVLLKMLELQRERRKLEKFIFLPETNEYNNEDGDNINIILDGKSYLDTMMLNAEGGKTALFVACERGHINIVRLLLKGGASQNVVNGFSYMNNYNNNDNDIEKKQKS